MDEERSEIMAGGRFDPAVGKERPGTYINFEAKAQNRTDIAGRGTVLLPLIGHTYGAEKEFITLHATSPDAQHAKLGYSIYDDNRCMMLVREAFKRAITVVVYIPKTGTKATAEGGGLSATAMYGGSRGNDLSYSVVANPVGGFDVSVYLAGSTVSCYEGLQNTNELINKKCEYLTFRAKEESLTVAAGVALSGGEDAETTNLDISTFLDAAEGVKFHTLAFPVTDAALKVACKAKIKYLREQVGKNVKAVIPDFEADYEGIINVTNSVAVDGVELTHAEACAWVAGADAGASNVQSNTGMIYEGATAILDAKEHEQAVAAIKKGEFFFSYSEEGRVVVEYDINSLVTFGDEKGRDYRKNRVMRVFDTFADTLLLNIPPNKFDNEEIGWGLMEGVGKSILKKFGARPEGVGALKNIDYENDFMVDQAQSKGDETYFVIGLEPVDSAEKIYFTIKTR